MEEAACLKESNERVGDAKVGRTTLRVRAAGATNFMMKER